MRYHKCIGGEALHHPIRNMAILESCPELTQVDYPVISVARQMAFYLSVEEASIEFVSISPMDDSCTIRVGKDFWDVFYNSGDSMVTEYIPAA
mgnify:CR=1 FL=1